jgi:phage terminase large subunit-like protein
MNAPVKQGQLDLIDGCTQYALDVVEKRIVAGPYVRLACERHLRDLDTGAARGLTWHPDRVAHYFKFAQSLKFFDGPKAGQYFRLEPPQMFIGGSIYGWYGADGERRFRVFYGEMGKGNGKTPTAASVALYELFVESLRNPGAEVYAAAVGRDQAKICHGDAEKFINASTALRKRALINVNNIAYPRTNSFFRPISSEGKGLDGKRVHCAVIDELHEHPSSIVVDKMTLGTKGRLNSLIFEITNAGFDRHSVCWAHHDYSVKVLQGVIHNDAWLAYVCALDEGDDWKTDESVWVKTNPLLDVAVTAKYLREQVKQAIEIPSKENIVARLAFCVWTEQATRWIKLAHWDACIEPVDEAALVGRECYAGIDLSSTTDITAVIYVFPPKGADTLWRLVCRFWLPGDSIKARVESDHVPYDVWTRDKVICKTDGNIVDYEAIRTQIKLDAKKFRIKEAAIDRWNATQLATWLQEDGLLVCYFGQGYASMSAPAKEFEKLVVGKRLAHGGNPVLRWMASNVSKLEDAAGNIKPDKSKSTGRIDGIVASIMGIGRATANVAQSSIDQWLTAQ